MSLWAVFARRTNQEPIKMQIGLIARQKANKIGDMRWTSFGWPCQGRGRWNVARVLKKKTKTIVNYRTVSYDCVIRYNKHRLLHSCACREHFDSFCWLHHMIHNSSCERTFCGTKTLSGFQLLSFCCPNKKQTKLMRKTFWVQTELSLGDYFILK